MDRFNSFASQAKAKAEQGRTALNSQLNKPGGPSPSPSPSGRFSPAPSTSHTSTPTAFVGISSAEKEAFMTLLDEYFESRPQYRDLFLQGGGRTVPIPVAAATRAAPPPAPPARQKGLGTATALYDYPGGESEDLPLEEGDQVTILEHVSEDWWRGELKGREGIFPCTYVQMDA